ncbi:unnamed protein product [Ectocarpus sp. 12 AP-2014]
MLENGCRARMRTSDQVVLVRGGLQRLIMDSPEHSDRTNTKNANGCTLRSCQRCKVPRRHLGNLRYDIQQNRRTAEGVDADIEYVKHGATKTERVDRAKQRGVVVPKVSNPLKKLPFDRQLQVPFDILHADSLNKCGRMINSVLSACNADGLAVVSGRLSLRQLLPPNVSPFADITTAGGWAGLTGMQKWILSSIFGLVFASIFADVNSMEKYVRSAEIEAVATRIGSDCDTPRGKEKVCRAF